MGNQFLRVQLAAGKQIERRRLFGIQVGIVGALLAGFLVTPLIGGAPITSGVISIRSILASLFRAIVLLAIINLFRLGAVR